MLACGWVQTGIQLIMVRAVAGIGMALCSPTSVAIVSNSVPNGRARNLAFAVLGFSAPLGFSVGLVLEGILLDTIGWRAGMFLCGALNLALFVSYIWILPKDKLILLGNETNDCSTLRAILNLMNRKIDWIGALIACSSLAMLSYILACVNPILFRNG